MKVCLSDMRQQAADRKRGTVPYRDRNGMATKEPTIIPLSSKTSVAIVSEKLEELIVDGFWKPDEKILSESELCTRFNVGRSTIREALNVLKVKNLVYTVPGLGTFAAAPEEGTSLSLNSYIPDPKSAADLINVMELRLSLEPMNAAFAARRATKAQIEEMRDRHQALLGTGGSGIFAESDLQFHLLIARAAANPMLEDAMNVVKDFLMKQQILTSQEQWRRSQAGKFHDRLLEAIVRRDEREAEDAMREHMDDTYLYIKSLVDKGGRQSGRWPRRSPRRKTGKK